MYFSVKFGKTQGLLKTLEKTKGPQEKPKIGSKNPRPWEKTQGVATLLTANV